MAAVTNGVTSLEATTHLPITQLTPLLNAPATRSIKAVVTLTWPYSSATGSIAFLLAEPDFRLRRTRGQVRVQFAGSSAKAVAKAGIASGDEVNICLDGVEWLENQHDAGTPGRGVEVELKFTERLQLQFKQEGAHELSTINIDHPPSEPDNVPVFARIPTPEPSPPTSIANGTPMPQSTIVEATDEWSSPAFLKRARTSYGSLFDSDYDPFSEADGTIPGKRRKKTRLSAVWRYSSRSPSPEEEDLAVKEFTLEPISKPAPVMMDEACQTVGLELGAAAQTLAAFARQATNVGNASYPQSNGSQIAEAVPSSKETHAFEEEEEAVAMPPPRIQTQEIEMETGEAMDLGQQAPSSPRLYPISSDSLPLVSPLVSQPYGLDFDRLGQLNHDTPSQQMGTNGSLPQDEEEDIYGASPIRRRGDAPRSAFNGFQEPPGGGQIAAFPAVAASFAIEDQYGHWQNANAQLSHSASPSKQEEDHYEDKVPMAPPMGLADYSSNPLAMVPPGGSIYHPQHYPEIDPQLEDRVHYPRLSDREEDLQVEEPIYHQPARQSSAMSRSQSARSQSIQSQVVDLTEDSDEQEEDAEGEDDRSVRKSAELDEEAIPAYDSRDENIRGDRQRTHRMTHGYNAVDGEESDADADGESDGDSDADADGSQDVGNENVYYMENDADGELEEDPRYQQTLHGSHVRYEDGEEEDEEESFDEEEEEEEDYDEDEMEDNEPPSARGPPVVIDLLSSDDEEEPSTSIPAARQISHPQAQPALSESDRESNESDADDMDEKENIPYEKRDEIRTYIRREANPQAAEQDDEDDNVGYGDEELEESSDDQEADHRAEGPQKRGELLQEEALSADESQDDEEAEEGNEDPIDQDLMAEGDDQLVDAEDEPQTPENEQAATPTGDETPKDPINMDTAEEKKTSSAKSGLFSRMFGTDGSNDESSPTTSSFPIPPNEEPSPPASSLGTKSKAQDAIKLPEHGNAQLPTPDVSQFTERILSTEASFTSTIFQETSQTNMSISQEIHTVKQGEISTETETAENITLVVSSTKAESHAPDDEPLSQDTGETINDEISLELNEVVMTEVPIENTEVRDRKVVLESANGLTLEDATMVEDSSLIEEAVEGKDVTNLISSPRHDESAVSDLAVEGKPNSEVDQQTHTQNDDITMVDENAETGENHPSDQPSKSNQVFEPTADEIDEADEHSIEAESIAEEASNDIEEPEAIEVNSESEGEAEAIETPKPNVTTRSGAHEVSSDIEELEAVEVDSESDGEAEAEATEQSKPNVTTRSAAHEASSDIEESEAVEVDSDGETEAIEQPRPNVTTRSAAHEVSSDNEAEAESIEQPKPNVTTRAASHEIEGAHDQPRPNVTTRSAAHHIEEESESPGPTVHTRAAAHAMVRSGLAIETDEVFIEKDTIDKLPSVEKASESIEPHKDAEVVIEEPEFTQEHPRRSHRRAKSATSATKTDEDVRPVTPVKHRGAKQVEADTNEDQSPMVVIDAHATPKGHDASIELALSSLDSPSQQPHDLRKPPVADLKLRLSRALRTELSEFTALKVLRYHMNQKLDILAVATTTPPEPQRAKGGPRHYQITFNITDPSIAPSGVTEVQVFRPYSHALPTISAGDGILLRNFQVSSVQKGFALRSTQEEGSSWAVFKDGEEPEVRGPPVEFGDGEKNHIIALKTWYASLDDVSKTKLSRANGDKVAARR